MSVKSKTTIKKVQTHFSQVQGEVEAEEAFLQQRIEELKKKKKIANNLAKKIKKLNKPEELECSEHSLLRWAERVLGIDFELAKKEICSSEIIEMMKVLGTSGTFPNKLGYSLVVKDNVVVSIIVPNGDKK